MISISKLDVEALGFADIDNSAGDVRLAAFVVLPNGSYRSWQSRDGLYVPGRTWHSTLLAVFPNARIVDHFGLASGCVANAARAMSAPPVVVVGSLRDVHDAASKSQRSLGALKGLHLIPASKTDEVSCAVVVALRSAAGRLYPHGVATGPAGSVVVQLVTAPRHGLSLAVSKTACTIAGIDVRAGALGATATGRLMRRVLVIDCAADGAWHNGSPTYDPSRKWRVEGRPDVTFTECRDKEAAGVLAAARNTCQRDAGSLIELAAPLPIPAVIELLGSYSEDAMEVPEAGPPAWKSPADVRSSYLFVDRVDGQLLPDLDASTLHSAESILLPRGVDGRPAPWHGWREGKVVAKPEGGMYCTAGRAQALWDGEWLNDEVGGRSLYRRECAHLLCCLIRALLCRSSTRSCASRACGSLACLLHPAMSWLQAHLQVPYLALMRLAPRMGRRAASSSGTRCF